jgi:hypothetical protein
MNNNNALVTTATTTVEASESNRSGRNGCSNKSKQTLKIERDI